MQNEYYWLSSSILAKKTYKNEKYWDFRENVYEESNYDRVAATCRDVFVACI